MICKDLQKYVLLQQQTNCCMGFQANIENKKDMKKIISDLKNQKNFKEEKLSTNNGMFYEFSADVDDSLFPYKVQIFFAKLNKTLFGSMEFFRVEII